MSEHLRDRLHEEMSGIALPPADNLVDRAVARGLRTRRLRRTTSGVGTVAVVGLTVLAVTLGSQIGAGPASPAAQQAGAAPVAQVSPPAQVPATPVALPSTAAQPAAVVTTTAAPTAGTVDDKVAMAKAWHARQAAAAAASPPQWTAQPTGVPATPQGELQLFAELAKPYGVASNFTVSEDTDKTHVSAHLTNAEGQTGMLQFSLLHDTVGYAGDCLPDAPNLVRCDKTDDGGYVIVADDHAGCVNTADITVVHPDGTAVQIFLASCLTDAANQTIPGTQTLTIAQAEAIFQDHRFDFTMPADVVDRGMAKLGALATFH